MHNNEDKYTRSSPSAYESERKVQRKEERDGASARKRERLREDERSKK